MTMRNHHEEFVRYSGIMKREKPEPKKKIIWKRYWRRHLTDENSFLRQTLKRIWEQLRKIRRVR
jgi:hypothetical protein